MIGKSALIIGQMLGLFVGDQFSATDALTKEQYANYYFQFRAY